MHLGHTNRIAAHRDTISEMTACVLQFHQSCSNRTPGFDELNTAMPDHCPWTYAQVSEHGSDIAFFSWEMLVQIHIDIQRAIAKCGDFSRGQQIAELRQMAWLCELGQRRHAGISQTILDIDPLSHRLLVITAEAIDEIWEPSLFDEIEVNQLLVPANLDPASIPSPSVIGLVHSLIEANGGYQANTSIPLSITASHQSPGAIKSISLLIEAGTIEASAHLDGHMLSISPHSITLQAEPAESQWLLCRNTLIDDIVECRLASGLGIHLTEKLPSRASEIGQRIHHDAHLAKRLAIAL